MAIAEKLFCIALLAFVAGIYALEILLVIIYVTKRHKAEKPKNLLLSKFALCVHLFAAIGIACLIYGYFFEPYSIEVKTVQIETSKFSKTGLRIVHISDLHCDKKIRNEGKLAGLINPLNPDIIVFTGDSLNTIEALPLFKGTLKGLRATIGKYAIRGNCDVQHWDDLDLFEDTDFKKLEDGGVKLQKDNEVFYLSGLDGRYNSIRYNKKLPTFNNKYYSIFLHHCPDLVEDLEGLNIDLYLAGHTHGGQIAIPFYGALITLSKHGKKYESGKFNIGDSILYVNRGIGMAGGLLPKIRFFAKPEITVFDIKPK